MLIKPTRFTNYYSFRNIILCLSLRSQVRAAQLWVQKYFKLSKTWIIEKIQKMKRKNHGIKGTTIGLIFIAILLYVDFIYYEKTINQRQERISVVVSMENLIKFCLYFY